MTELVDKVIYKSVHHTLTGGPVALSWFNGSEDGAACVFKEKKTTNYK